MGYIFLAIGILTGFPCSWVSIFAKSFSYFSTASAKAKSASLRFSIGVCDHDLKASWAAATASSTSFGVETGTSGFCFPVAGLIPCLVFSVLVSFPLMVFLKSSETLNCGATEPILNDDLVEQFSNLKVFDLRAREVKYDEKYVH